MTLRSCNFSSLKLEKRAKFTYKIANWNFNSRILVTIIFRKGIQSAKTNGIIKGRGRWEGCDLNCFFNNFGNILVDFLNRYN